MPKKGKNSENLRSWVVRSADKATEWKQALVHHVVSHDFIRYGDSLLIGSGTTPIYLTKAVLESQIARRQALDLAIVTSSLQVLYAVRDAQRDNADIFGNTQVIFTGGRLNNSLDSMVGDHAARAILDDAFHPRVVFFGAAGLTFRNGLNITFHFEEEISTQVAFATRPTVNRVLLCDHTKLGRLSFYDSNLSIDSLMKTATNCYVITSYDADDPNVVAAMEEEERALVDQFGALVDRDDLKGKDFVLRMVRKDGRVEREIRLDEIRRRRTARPVEPIPSRAR